MKASLLVILAFVLCILTAVPAQADSTVITTVRSVRFYNPRSAASYCQINLANGRTLSYVWDAECQAQPSQTVVLEYRTVTACLLWICHNTEQLVDWRLQ